MSRSPDTIEPAVVRTRAAGNSFVNSRAFEVISRAGFIARGLVYGVIGLLALDVALGRGGKITNQQGALRTVEHQHLGHLLLALVAAGLAGYSLWRLIRAIVGHGPEGADRGVDRLGALGSGVVYAVMCSIAIRLLTGTADSTGNAKKTASGVLGWPAGRWIVGAAGLVMIGVGVYQLIRGLRKKFLNDSKTEQMSPVVRQWIAHLGTIGHIARAIVFGLVGIFLVRSAVDHTAREAIGLDGALAKLYHHTYGPWLLGIVAAGLIAFAIFSISEARYRRI